MLLSASMHTTIARHDELIKHMKSTCFKNAQKIFTFI